MPIRTCVTPEKKFSYGIHKPSYTVTNLREAKKIDFLGHLTSGEPCSNETNFPQGELEIEKGDWIFEIPNPFPFRGSTFIDQEWADASSAHPESISLPKREELSLSKILSDEQIPAALFAKLPVPLLLALATTSTDGDDLVRLAEISCEIEKSPDGHPQGLRYSNDHSGKRRPLIHHHALFEAVANNPVLPDSYKTVMVLRPGAQGGSEIVGDYRDEESHVFEYLRRNSYIADGHYAANMADDAIRYSIETLSEADITGLRHLYHQRTFIRLATDLGLPPTPQQHSLSIVQLEKLRLQIVDSLKEQQSPRFNATLWGWNFGFDYAPTDYRLHASHQQIHQQYSMLPKTMETFCGDPLTPTGTMDSFGCGDMVAEVIRSYKGEKESDFFTDYLQCIRNNMRMDRDEHGGKESGLILWEDDNAILFVPKAQTSQWELQLMALYDTEGKAIGNIVEANSVVRESLNKGIFLAQKALAALGARMVTSIEYPKRLGQAGQAGQHLLYSLLPRLPQSPGAFSEAQLRYINGHYPEDFAAACRKQLKRMELPHHS